MDREQSWQVITEQRLGLARCSRGCPTPSGSSRHCARMARPRRRSARSAAGSRAGVDARRRDPGPGSFHRLNHDVAVRHAARPTRDIVAELRTYADSRRLPVVTNYRNIGFDVLVHTQDIAIPLGRDYPMPTEAALAGAERCGPWDGRSGPATASAECGCSPPTPTGPPVLGSNCGADRDASAAVDRAHHDGAAPPVGSGRAHHHRAHRENAAASHVQVLERFARSQGQTPATMQGHGRIIW